MRIYRVGLVGCGGRQEEHVAAFRQFENCEIVAAADRIEEARRAFAQRQEIPRTYASVRGMVAEAGCDIVTVVTRARWMVEPVMEALEAGARAVLVEKPFGVDLEEAREMRDTAEAKGATLLVNHQYRFFEAAERMRETLLGGELGEVEFFRAVSAIKLHGQGTHMIDFVRFLHDDRPFTWALGSFAGKESFDAKQIGPDYAGGALAFDDGVPLYVDCGAGSSQAPYPGNPLNLYADAVCTKGRAWFGLSHGLRIWRSNGPYEEAPASWPEIGDRAQVRLVASLIDTMENGTENRCHARIAYATQEALCALLQSALLHQKVAFPPQIEPGLMERVRRGMKG